MYDDNNWNDVTGEELEGLLDQDDVKAIGYKTSMQSTKAAWRALPFYEDVVLIRLRDPSWGNKRLTIYFLTDQGILYRLMGQSPPIHEVNGKAPIQVTEDNVLDYLRFFCYFVRGEEGPFLIVESIDNPDLPKDLDTQTRAVVEGTVRAASYEGRNDQGHMLCEGRGVLFQRLVHRPFRGPAGRHDRNARRRPDRGQLAGPGRLTDRLKQRPGLFRRCRARPIPDREEHRLSPAARCRYGAVNDLNPEFAAVMN